MDRAEQAKALGSEARLSILSWLKEPGRHFAYQVTDDPDTIGVCVTLIAAKLGFSQPTTSRHLELLKHAGFVTSHRIGRWSFYRRNEAAIAEYGRWIHDDL